VYLRANRPDGSESANLGLICRFLECERDYVDGPQGSLSQSKRRLLVLGPRPCQRKGVCDPRAQPAVRRGIVTARGGRFSPLGRGRPGASSHASPHRLARRYAAGVLPRSKARRKSARALIGRWPTLSAPLNNQSTYSDQRSGRDNERELFRMNIDPRPISEPAAEGSAFRKWMKRVGSFIWAVLSMPWT
jgi:hypothetical protein